MQVVRGNVVLAVMAKYGIDGVDGIADVPR